MVNFFEVMSIFSEEILPLLSKHFERHFEKMTQTIAFGSDWVIAT